MTIVHSPTNKENIVKIAIPKRDISFCDGTMHRKGQRVNITPETAAYYESEIAKADYDILEDVDFTKGIKLREPPKIEVRELTFNGDDQLLNATVRVYLFQENGEWHTFRDFSIPSWDFHRLENTDEAAPKLIKKYTIPDDY